MLSAPHHADRAVLHPTSADYVSGPMVDVAVQSVRAAGHRGPITTPALTPDETHGFRAAGFDDIARLLLFKVELDKHERSFTVAPTARGLTLHRLPRLSRRQEAWLRAALEVDHAAFQVGERFDQLSIDEALHATPRRLVRFVVDPRGSNTTASLPTVDGKRLVAYAITGRAGHRGYLQRLAVHPAYQGKGVGALLCADAIGWARNGHADVLAVNTREDNARAARLYTRMGFQPVIGGLTVLGVPALDGEP